MFKTPLLHEFHTIHYVIIKQKKLFNADVVDVEIVLYFKVYSYGFGFHKNNCLFLKIHFYLLLWIKRTSYFVTFKRMLAYNISQISISNIFKNLQPKFFEQMITKSYIVSFAVFCIIIYNGTLKFWNVPTNIMKIF